MKWTLRIIFFLASISTLFAQGDNKDLFDQINEFRKERHLPPLEYTQEYQGSCDNWAKYISKQYGHRFYNQRDLAEVVSIDYPRENIIPDFMDSKPHKKALMDRAARKVCIGIYQAGPNEEIYTCIRTYR
jgi:uncharacterized protein YkwD